VRIMYPGLGVNNSCNVASIIDWFRCWSIWYVTYTREEHWVAITKVSKHSISNHGLHMPTKRLSHNMSIVMAISLWL